MNQAKTRRREFLREYFFPNCEEYKELELMVNEHTYYLVHRWEGNGKYWEVAIFDKEGFVNMHGNKLSLL